MRGSRKPAAQLTTTPRIRLRLDGDGGLTSSVAGLMVESWWGNLLLHFAGIELGAHVVMPNHFRGLISLGTEPSLSVGVARRGHPDSDRPAPSGERVSLSDIVGWFKSITTNDYGKGVRHHGWPPYEKRLWQRSFYEHIVRNDHDLARIEEYIAANPASWEMDELHTE